MFGIVDQIAGLTGLEFDQGKTWVLGSPQGGGAMLGTSAKMI